MARRYGLKPKVEEWSDDFHLQLFEGWARRGLTVEDIAEKIGITKQTLYTWTKKEPRIFDALNTGREQADTIVENALYKRAVGYQYYETTWERNEFGEMVETKKVLKEERPSSTAQIFWLKNRKPDDWRDRKEKAITGNLEIGSVEDTAKRIREMVEGVKTDDPGEVD